MDWRDEGIVLTLRPLGESGAVVTLLTREHGRHAGLARGGAGRRGRALYQTGNRLAATWRARLGEQLGTLSAELIEAHGARFIEDPLRLAALASASAMAEGALPEREPHRAVYDRFLTLLTRMEEDESSAEWPADYARWELALLADLGFGCPELGSFSLVEIASVRLPFGLGIERDLYFEGTFPLSVYAEAARKAGRIVLDEARLTAAAEALREKR